MQMQARRLADIHAASLHDRAQSELGAVVFQWDAASGYMPTGDRFMVCNPNHWCAEGDRYSAGDHQCRELHC